MGAFMERKVSAMTSRRVRDCFSASSGPKAAGPKTEIQAAFICGSPAILLRPLRTKVEGRVWAGGEAVACFRQRVVEEDFVDDEGEVVFDAESFELGCVRAVW